MTPRTGGKFPLCELASACLSQRWRSTGCLPGRRQSRLRSRSGRHEMGRHIERAAAPASANGPEIGPAAKPDASDNATGLDLEASPLTIGELSKNKRERV